MNKKLYVGKRYEDKYGSTHYGIFKASDVRFSKKIVHPNEANPIIGELSSDEAKVELKKMLEKVEQDEISYIRICNPKNFDNNVQISKHLVKSLLNNQSDYRYADYTVSEYTEIYIPSDEYNEAYLDEEDKFCKDSYDEDDHSQHNNHNAILKSLSEIDYNCFHLRDIQLLTFVENTRPNEDCSALIIRFRAKNKKISLDFKKDLKRLFSVVKKGKKLKPDGY